MFEALQRRKQLQRPHQTQHSAPPESGGPHPSARRARTRTHSQPGQETDPHPPPLPPGPGMLPLMGRKWPPAPASLLLIEAASVCFPMGRWSAHFASWRLPAKTQHKPLPHFLCKKGKTASDGSPNPSCMSERKETCRSNTFNLFLSCYTVELQTGLTCRNTNLIHFSFFLAKLNNNKSLKERKIP